MNHSALDVNDRDAAIALDRADPLASYREQFHIPLTAQGTPQSYFCGHSLGLQPRSAAALLNEELQVWQTQAVEGHFNSERPWLSYHELLNPALAELCGALPLEVVAMNSLTVNLHLLLISFYRPTTQRHKILIEASAFPSDRYAVASQLKLHGYDPAHDLIEVSPRTGEYLLRTEDLLAVLEHEGSRIATALLPGVQYLSGQRYDLQRITHAAHQQGCVVGFDLAHAIGNVPLQLHDWNVDFAAWCSYKYLNSGPGSIGGAFVHERHAQDSELPRLAGWWGHDKHSRFAMPREFMPLPGAEGWQLSNPPIFACAPLLASLRLFSSAGMQALRSKSLQLTAYLETLLNTYCPQVSIITPTDPQQRGCQLSLRLPLATAQAQQLHQQLLSQGVMCDWREPNIIRVAPVPLYNTYLDVHTFVSALQGLLA
ncbi:MAG: kynureninase [Steroidobacteraceae bacterium]